MRADSQPATGSPAPHDDATITAVDQLGDDPSDNTARSTVAVRDTGMGVTERSPMHPRRSSASR